MYKQSSMALSVLISALILSLSGCDSFGLGKQPNHPNNSTSSNELSEMTITNKTGKKPISNNSSEIVSNSTAAQKTSAAPAQAPPSAALINVAPLSQYPQLPNGCEVTSLSMLLTAVGHPVGKVKLAHEEPTDPTKRIYKSDSTTTFWGNPNVGFVGSPFERDNGYGIYHGPITKLLNEILPGQAIDLTGQPFTRILQSVADGIPVVVWDTATFKPTNSWTSWNTPEGQIKVTLEEHAVLLVGYDSTQLFVNNPLNGEKAEPVNRSNFIAAWRQLGEQAVTVKKQATE